MTGPCFHTPDVKCNNCWDLDKPSFGYAPSRSGYPPPDTDRIVAALDRLTAAVELQAAATVYAVSPHRAEARVVMTVAALADMRAALAEERKP